MVSPVLSALLDEFRKTKRMGERAFEQLEDEDFFFKLNPQQNSVYAIVKHLSGNMLSRWTDFLTTDGEKADRNRDTEFELEPGDTRKTILARWEDGWNLLFAALTPLTEADLSRNVPIRGEPHTVLQAVHRQLTHYAYHVGQIVFLARHFAGSRWRSLSIPKGKSKEFEVARSGKPYRVR